MWFSARYKQLVTLSKTLGSVHMNTQSTDWKQGMQPLLLLLRERQQVKGRQFHRGKYPNNFWGKGGVEWHTDLRIIRGALNAQPLHRGSMDFSYKLS